MTISIEKLREDLAYQQARQLAEQEKQRKEDRRARWTISLQLIAALGTAFAGGAAVLGLTLHWMGKL